MNCAELYSVKSRCKSESRRPEDCHRPLSVYEWEWDGNAGGQTAGNNSRMLSYTIRRWQKPNEEEASWEELSFLLAD